MKKLSIITVMLISIFWGGSIFAKNCDDDTQITRNIRGDYCVTVLNKSDCNNSFYYECNHSSGHTCYWESAGKVCSNLQGVSCTPSSADKDAMNCNS